MLCRYRIVYLFSVENRYLSEIGALSIVQIKVKYE